VKRLKRFYTWADQRSGGSLSILGCAAQRFGEMRAAEAAASVAYWAFFSLFPLLLFLVAIGSFVLASEQVYGPVVNFAGQIFPGSQGLIQQNIQQVLTRRGPVGLIGLVGLLWSASEAFDALSRHINRAWSTARPRAAWQYRLLGLGMIGALVATLAWQLAARAFAWFLRSGLAQYQLIYGSLGTVVTLMLWIYLCSWITLFGAHLSAAVAHRARTCQSVCRQSIMRQTTGADKGMGWGCGRTKADKSSLALRPHLARRGCL
jgi:uncharacterized BrkB/YihY/UPF0761 family membrane protein